MNALHRSAQLYSARNAHSLISVWLFILIRNSFVFAVSMCYRVTLTHFTRLCVVIRSCVFGIVVSLFLFLFSLILRIVQCVLLMCAREWVLARGLYTDCGSIFSIFSLEPTVTRATSIDHTVFHTHVCALFSVLTFSLHQFHLILFLCSSRVFLSVPSNFLFSICYF